MTQSLKNYINAAVYEENAEYPLAKIKDFVISSDGKNVCAAEISTQSLVPVSYMVKFEDIKKLEKNRCILKEGTKPQPIPKQLKEGYYFSGIKKLQPKGGGIIKPKIRDAEFMTEAGEIVDFVAAAGFWGHKMYLNLRELLNSSALSKNSKAASSLKSKKRGGEKIE